MTTSVYDGLTHDSGTESNAQAASNTPFINQIAEVVCDKLASEQYVNHGFDDDGFGLFYLTEIRLGLPDEIYRREMEYADYDELGKEIDEQLRLNRLPHYHYYGDCLPVKYARTLEETEPSAIVLLYDDRRPPQSWVEIEGVQERRANSPLMPDGLPF